ncbi:MAG: hypothetical protein AB1384_13645 [Actinomycetota bacterium]
MYSDHEVECMYLGKPFEERNLHGEDRHGKESPPLGTEEPQKSPELPRMPLLVAAAG